MDEVGAVGFKARPVAIAGIDNDDPLPSMTGKLQGAQKLGKAAGMRIRENASICDVKKKSEMRNRP